MILGPFPLPFTLAIPPPLPPDKLPSTVQLRMRGMLTRLWIPPPSAAAELPVKREFTMEGCVCSQFENHVRAVVGWPLGEPRLVAPAAVMVNLLGAGKGSGRPAGLEQALAVPGAHLHVYGKATAGAGRKMGHVTALGATLDEALATAQRAADLVRFGYPAA